MLWYDNSFQRKHFFVSCTFFIKIAICASASNEFVNCTIFPFYALEERCFLLPRQIHAHIDVDRRKSYIQECCGNAQKDEESLQPCCEKS